MKLKILLIVLAMVLFGSVRVAEAQYADVPTPERQAKRMTKAMAERLHLSKDQTQQVQDLNLSLAQEKVSLLNNEKLDFFKRLEKLHALSDTREEKLKQILDDQQYQLYNTLNHRTRNDYKVKD